MPGISTKTYGYDLRSSDQAGDVKVKNYCAYFDKKRRVVVFSFDAKWSTGTGDSVVKAYRDIEATYHTLGTITDPVLGRWISYKYELDTNSTIFSFKKQTYNFALDVEETDNPSDQAPHPLIWIPVEVDNDIMEHEVTIISDDFGDDSTPDIKFRINNLERIVKMKPYITVDGTSTDDARVYFTDGTYEDLTNMDVSADTGGGGWYFVNGLTFSDIGSPHIFNNASMRFTDIDYFQITAPTVSAGHNNYDLNIKVTTS